MYNETKQLNGFQSSLVLLFTPVLFLLCDVSNLVRMNKLFWVEFDDSADELLLWLEAMLEAQCYVRADWLISYRSNCNYTDKRTTVELLVHASVAMGGKNPWCRNGMTRRNEFASILTPCLHSFSPLPVSTLDTLSHTTAVGLCFASNQWFIHKQCCYASKIEENRREV